MGYSYALRIGPDIGGNTNDVPNKPSFHLGVYSVGVVADRYYFDPTPPDAKKLDPDKIRPIRQGYMDNQTKRQFVDYSRL